MGENQCSRFKWQGMIDWTCVHCMIIQDWNKRNQRKFESDFFGGGTCTRSQILEPLLTHGQSDRMWPTDWCIVMCATFFDHRSLQIYDILRIGRLRKACWNLSSLYQAWSQRGATRSWHVDESMVSLHVGFLRWSGPVSMVKMLQMLVENLWCLETCMEGLATQNQTQRIRSALLNPRNAEYR